MQEIPVVLTEKVFHMVEPREVLKRLAEELGIPSKRGWQAALRRRLDVTEDAMDGWMRRNSIDDRLVLEVCAREGISADWLYRDLGPRRIGADVPDSPAEPLPPEPEGGMSQDADRRVIVPVASVAEIQRLVEGMLRDVSRIGRDAEIIHQRMADLVDTASELAGDR